MAIVLFIGKKVYHVRMSANVLTDAFVYGGMLTGRREVSRVPASPVALGELGSGAGIRDRSEGRLGRNIFPFVLVTCINKQAISHLC